MKPVRLLGVPLDLGGGRRGVDMGPSAFRIAGLAGPDRPARTSRRRPRQRGDAAAGDRTHLGTSARNTWTTSPTCAATCSRPLTTRFACRRAAPGPRRRSQPGGGLGGRQRRLDARLGVGAGRPHLGGRARRHEHAGDVRPAATSTACLSRRCSAGAARARRRSAGDRRCLPGTRCWSECATWTTARRTRFGRPACTCSR